MTGEGRRPVRRQYSVRFRVHTRALGTRPDSSSTWRAGFDAISFFRVTAALSALIAVACTRRIRAGLIGRGGRRRAPSKRRCISEPASWGPSERIVA